MRTLRLVACLGLLGLLLVARGDGQSQDKVQGGIDLKVAKYAGLADVILKNRGKVVVVDFWRTT